jgi:hypothetical protein
MAESTGKTIALIILVVLILFLALRLTPLFIAPFGVFTNMFRAVRIPDMDFDWWPHAFKWTSISIFSLVLLVLWIVVIVWVYRDAERRGMNGVLWALLVLIGSIIGLLIYLIVRSDVLPATQRSKAAQVCPECNQDIGQGYTFCPHCGKRLQGGVCPGCGKPVEPNWKVCASCGENISKDKLKKDNIGKDNKKK